MDKKSLEEKAQDLAWKISERPWIYVPLVRIINAAARMIGFILSPLTALKDKGK